MTIAETLRGLIRRWYITVPGIVLSIALAAGAWAMITPGYERNATQLLLPGKGNLPSGDNPFLYIGGLSQAADVIVGVVGAGNVIDPIMDEYPGTEISVSRDPSTSGPSILISVTAKSDSAAAAVMHKLIDETAVALDDIQQQEKVSQGDRITVVPVTVDDHSTLQQKTRIKDTAGAGIAGVVLTLLLAALVEGLSSRRRRGGRKVESGPVLEPLRIPLTALDEEAEPVSTAHATRSRRQ